MPILFQEMKIEFLFLNIDFLIFLFIQKRNFCEFKRHAVYRIFKKSNILKRNIQSFELKIPCQIFLKFFLKWNFQFKTLNVPFQNVPFFKYAISLFFLTVQNDPIFHYFFDFGHFRSF